MCYFCTAIQVSLKAGEATIPSNATGIIDYSPAHVLKPCHAITAATTSHSYPTSSPLPEILLELNLSMYHSLHMWIHGDHSLIQIGILPHQYLGIESHRHKEGTNSALDWHQEDIANLQSDQERKGHHHRCITTSRVIFRLCEGNVEIGEEGADVGNEYGTHG